jgi:hypothetical protein
MNQSAEKESAGDSMKEHPQAAMEQTLLEQYLQSKGYSFKELCNLPEEEAKALMIEACKYASTKLAAVESTAHFREKIRGPS